MGAELDELVELVELVELELEGVLVLEEELVDE